MTAARTLRVLVAADREAARLLGEAIQTSLPTTEIVALDVDALLGGRPLPLAAAQAMVIEESVGGRAGLDLARAARATGYAGTIVLVVGAPAPAIEAAAHPLGARVVARDLVARALPETLAEAAAAEGSPARQELRRVQRLLAIGEVAAGFQHAINNPLTALLAEAQLLELEPLDAPTRDAVRRIIELCRRVIATVRRLDVLPRRRPDEGRSAEAPPRA